MRPPTIVSLTLLLGACSACAPPHPPSSGATAPPADAVADRLPASEGALLVRNARLPGGTPVAIGVEDGQILAVDADLPLTGRVLDAEGEFVSPAFVDAHVHLAYLPVGDELARRGVAAAVDLANPLSAMSDQVPLRVLRAGPMLTAPAGYPTQSWGRDGYGLPCEGVEACAAAVERLRESGAGLVKVAVTAPPALSDDELSAIVEAAHALDLRVAAHALTDEGVRRAAAAGVDLLAHTPTERLSDDTVAAWSGRAVVSTLVAFGASDAAIDNLRRLRAAGVTVLYGTDLGNTREAGIDARELAALQAAGLTPSEVLAAGTAVPADYFGFAGLGSIAVGAEARFVFTVDDPLDDPTTLASPTRVLP